MDEVEKALGRIRKGKASGIDGIPIELYSSDIKYFTPLLTTLFNTIFDSADYPDDWTQGLIYPAHKNGDKSDPQNYRKVSLIPSLAKVFESVLENRLSFKNLVCRDDDPLQRGFKKDCRTSDNLFVLYNLVETQKTRKKPLYVCYIDLTKAFDYLNRDALILKLQQRNVYGNFLNAIKSMFLKSSSRVKWNGKISKPIKNRYGVMQGGVLSPRLFNEFLQDLRKYLNPNYGLKIGDIYLAYLLFADDIFYKYCEIWNLIISIAKTTLVIYKQIYVKHSFSFTLAENTLEIVDKYKYLGLWCSNNKNTFVKNHSYLAEQARKAIFTIRNYSHNLGHLTPKLSLKVFQAQIEPILMYGSEVLFIGKEILDFETVHFRLGASTGQKYSSTSTST